MKIEFINSLTESRLYRNADTLDGKTATDLSKVLFLMVLTVEMLRFGEEKFVKDYARKTIQYGDFNHMRVSCTDLGNLASVLSNQDYYSDKIQTDFEISVPLLQFKTYLRGVRDEDSIHSNDRNFFLKLEKYLKITDSKYKNFRRIIGDWEKMSKGERNSIITSIKQEYNSLAQNNDLIVYFKDHYKKLINETDENLNESTKELINTEDLNELSNLLIKDCSKALHAFKETGKFLYRGIKNPPSGLFLGKSRDNRQPIDSSAEIQQAVDTILSNAGASAIRSNSIFCTSNDSIAIDYGSPFFIIPKDNVNFTWSNKVKDLYQMMSDFGIHDETQIENLGYIDFFDTYSKVWVKLSELRNNIYINYIAPAGVSSFAKVDPSDPVYVYVDFFRNLNLSVLGDISENELIKLKRILLKFKNDTSSGLIKPDLLQSIDLLFFEFKKFENRHSHNLSATDIVNKLEFHFDEKFNEALLSGNEILIHGSYYALNRSTYYRFMDELLNKL